MGRIMKRMEEIVDSLLNLGIIVDENYEEILINDVIEDSLTFIAFIIELEQKLQIEIPDEYLVQGVLMTLADVDKMIDDIIP